MPRDSTTLFEDAIDVPLWLESDRLTPFAERARRDRDIARSLPQGDRVKRVRGWWRTVAAETPSGAGAKLARLRGVFTVAMAALGALAGAMVALAAFAYDGSQPVNVVRLLALLVGVQLLLLVLTLLLLPGRVPGFRHVQDLVATLNPGAWAAGVFRKLTRASPEIARLFDGRAARPAERRFAKWQVLFWSQTGAIAFNLSALATALMLVTFSDLAFGWSTTLKVDAATATRVAHAIAWPWHAVAPYAVPSAALVEQSQFFRLASGDGAVSSARTLGAWWPFTLSALVTYGLLPRVLLLLLAAVRLRAATIGLLLDDARVTALVDRMASPEIETAAAIPERDEPQRAGIGVTPATPRSITGRAHALIWEDSLPAHAVHDYARQHLGLDVLTVAEAGGGHALAADRSALERIATDVDDTLVVFTPAWEPPLLELLDFLAEVRRRLGARASIVVAPVPDGPRAVTDVERDTWSRAIARLADPRLYVETGAV